MRAEERIALRQERDLSELFQDAIALYSQRFWSFFAIAAVVIPFGILVGILALEFTPTVDDVLFETPIVDQEAYDEALDDAVREFLIFSAVLLPVILLQALAQWLAALAIMAALVGLDTEPTSELSHARRQRGNTFTRAYGLVFARLWTLVGASLRLLFHILLLSITIIGVPWAIQRMVRWLFIHQAVIFDHTSAKAALSYSAHAVSGRWWRTLGIAILITIVVQVPGQLVGAIFGLAPVYISSTVTALMTAALLPLGVIAMTLLYFDLKLRKESDVALGIA